MGDKTAAVVVYVVAFVRVFPFQSERYSEHLPGFNFLWPQVFSDTYSGKCLGVTKTEKEVPKTHQFICLCVSRRPVWTVSWSLLVNGSTWVLIMLCGLTVKQHMDMNTYLPTWARNSTHRYHTDEFTHTHKQTHIIRFFTCIWSETHCSFFVIFVCLYSDPC